MDFLMIIKGIFKYFLLIIFFMLPHFTFAEDIGSTNKKNNSSSISNRVVGSTSSLIQPGQASETSVPAKRRIIRYKSLQDFNKGYLIGESDFAKFLKLSKQEASADKTGKTYFMLALVLHACTSTNPLHYSNYSTDFTYLPFIPTESDCSKLIRNLGNTNSHELVWQAVELGEPRAAAALATDLMPPGYSSWSLENKNKYQQQIHDFLAKARQKCIPEIFEALSNWADESISSDKKITQKIDQLSNLEALVMFYKYKIKENNGAMEMAIKDLILRSRGMPSDEKILAQSLGKSTFNSECVVDY